MMPAGERSNRERTMSVSFASGRTPVPKLSTWTTIGSGMPIT